MSRKRGEGASRPNSWCCRSTILRPGEVSGPSFEGTGGGMGGWRPWKSKAVSSKRRPPTTTVSCVWQDRNSLPTCLIRTGRGRKVGALGRPSSVLDRQKFQLLRRSRAGEGGETFWSLTTRGVSAWFPPTTRLAPDNSSRRSQVLGLNRGHGYPVLSVTNEGIDPPGFILGCGPRGHSAIYQDGDGRAYPVLGNQSLHTDGC
ncbi:uncharacterized protein B0H64DRAFT_14794 [Chaetomium fimeti]|uniref:Uncharacterized protein n=1 Tax=Chaetomium fimeti TaxID=1854472 RepID=A0AAE0HPL1_9PEZI|nr:hypothetical protein B0H64DRAFT_14794 [Chaetomium fimeti]